jgi:hypothetical protein
MTTLTTNDIEQKFADIEHCLIFGGDVCNKVSHLSWNGIVFIWQPQAHKNGGTIKRYKAYGNIHYYYCDKELTRQEAIIEVSKPPALRQAMIEANTIIECSMCGLVAVGKDALNPYQTSTFIGNQLFNKRAWGVMFYRMDNDNNKEPIMLSICPHCMDSIYNGKFKIKDDDIGRYD